MTSLLKMLSISIEIGVIKSLWSLFDQFPNVVDRIRRQSSWASCKLCSHRRRDATRQFRRVGGVYWALQTAKVLQRYDYWFDAKSKRATALMWPINNLATSSDKCPVFSELTNDRRRDTHTQTHTHSDTDTESNTHTKILEQWYTQKQQHVAVGPGNNAFHFYSPGVVRHWPTANLTTATPRTTPKTTLVALGDRPFPFLKVPDSLSQSW